MEKKKLVYLHNYLYLEYKDKAKIIFDNVGEDEFGCCLEQRIIIIPKVIKYKQSDWSLLSFLHEIGHLETNTPNMRRCVKEYLATQWALDKSKKIDFDVSSNYISIYQNYIYEWLDKAIKFGIKNIPSREYLKLKYQAKVNEKEV